MPYALPVVLLLLVAQCAVADAPPASEPNTHVDTITVEAAREHEKLERQVNKFVSGIAVERRDESLANWQPEIPMCPLVAGLPREDGEYMLTRLSQIAASAGAPLAPDHCKPNFFVVVTSEPDALLKAWSKRDVRIFENGDDHGYTEIRKFLNARVPVRAWYNAEIYNSDGTPLRYESSGVFNGFRVTSHAVATRIQFNTVRNLASVIVLVDAPRARGISFGQLAAYIAMVGLAQIKSDAKVSDTPSILQLFSDAGRPAPTGLTQWDQAFLKGLYHTEHLNRRQISAVKTTMIQDIAPQH
ncbi:MAG TPA: hypothetical protein VGN99_05890 [Steroidobacteraceae bacterium]|nr:hypothetical protein [Steroidobacteraceae bacterium]